MTKAAQAGIAEVEAGKIAVQKASDPQVKAFAQQMVDDHGKANEELTQLADYKGVKLPDGPSAADQKKLKKLQGTEGTRFDREYVHDMGVAPHKEAVSLFKKASASARDADVKAFAARTLPTLEHHLEMAQSLKVPAK